MKKILLTIGFLLCAYIAIAQVRYKVEYDISIEVIGGGTTFATADWYLRLQTPSNISATVFASSTTNGIPQNYTRDAVVILPERADTLESYVGQDFYPVGSSCNNQGTVDINFDTINCFPYEQLSFTCFRFNGQPRYRLYELESLRVLNNLNATNNLIPVCEGKEVRMSRNCVVDPFYALEYDLNGDLNFEGTLLPYGQHPAEIEINLSDFPGLSINQPFNIRYRHTNNASNNEYSDVLTYRFIPCSPGLDTNPPETIPTNCSDSEDGSFILDFDRSLNIGETLSPELWLWDGSTWIQLPDINNEFPILPSDLDAQNKYTWPYPLESGQYRVRYQSFLDGAQVGTASQFYFFEITSPDPVEFTTSKSDISCGISSQGTTTDGSITISATGGNPPYEYQIDGGSWIQFPGSVTVPSVAGTYNISVRDLRIDSDTGGCIGTPQTAGMETVQINQPSAIVIAENDLQDATSFGGNNGYIITDISGGTFFSSGNRYTYAWSRALGGTIPASVVSNPNASTFRINLQGLEADTYTLTITDANGCSTDRDFTIGQPDELLFNYPASVVDVDCHGRTNGEISITASGGLSDYRFELLKDDGTGTFVATGDNLNTTSLIGATFEVTGLEAGDYQVRLTDNLNNTNPDVVITSTTITVGQPDPIEFTITNTTDVQCRGGNDGSANINVTGGSGSYIFEWRKDGTTLYSSVQNPTNLEQGTYILTVRDANVAGCNAITPITNGEITIDEPTTDVSINIINVSSPTAGNNDGSISVQGQGGTPPYTYSWNTGQNTAAINNLGDGTYTVTVTDANGCPAVQSFTLNELSVSVINTPGEEIQCNGDLAGLTANASGGDNQYAYAWYNQNNPTIPIGTNPTIIGLSDGSYYVIVTDANGTGTPVTSSVVNISSPTSVTISNVTLTDVNCFGGSDGTVTISASGGTGALSYSIDNGVSFQASNTFTDLGETTYQVIVQDANNCTTVMQEHTINGPTDPIDLSFSQTDVLIFGQNIGAIDITVSGGNGGYTYSWSGPNGFSVTTEDISGLLAGTYTLTIQDARFASTTDNAGCTFTQEFTITQPDLLEVTINYETPNSDLKCNGDDDARLLATVNGGVSPFSYVWSKETSPGVFTQLADTSELLIGADAGTYQIQITDTNGATASDTFIVDQPDPLAITFTQTDVLCFGEATGAIDVTISGGTPPYIYLWSNAETTQDISNLTLGDYTLTLTDANDCELISEVITITQPDTPLSIADVNITNLTGFQTGNGAIQITVAGGTPTYSYQWRIEGTTNIIGTSNTIDNLEAGNYEVTITDSNNCPLVAVYQVTQPELLEVIIDYPILGGRILCNGDNTAILETTVTGGVPFLEGTPQAYYQYQWYNLNDLTTIISTNATIENLPAGSYTVTVNDANGNIATPSQAFIVGEPTAIDITIVDQQDPSCFNGNDGTITVQASGGTLNPGEDYYYSWSSGQTTASANGLSAGDYTVTAFDSNGCSLISQTITLGQPSPLFIQNIDLTPPTANGATDGSVTITVVGGTPPYTYQWFDANDNPLASTTNNLDNIGEGEYFVTITDAQGCQIIRRSIFQTEPDPLVVTIQQINQVQCNGASNASLRAIATGGVPFSTTPPYNFQWFDQNANPIGTGAIINNLAIGTYTVIVTDANGNTAQSNLYTITQPDPLNLSLTADFILCGDGNDWTIQSSVTGGTPPYTYLWSAGNGTQSTITDVLPGTYNLSVQDSRGCTIQQNITLTPPETLTITSFTITNPTCFEGNDGTIEIVPIGGTPPYVYSWSNGQTSQNATGLTAGVHTVEVTDAKGCMYLQLFELFDPEELIVDLGDDKTLCTGQSYTLDATIEDPLATYAWQADNGFTANTPQVTLTESGTYTVTVTTALGCISTDTIGIIALDTDISAEFLVSTDLFVGEAFVMVDVSNPLPDTVEWILPEQAQVIETNNQFAEVLFEQTGEYQITLKTTVGDCEALFTKNITVRQPAFDREQQNNNLKKYLLYPNPNNGNFTLELEFEQQTPIDIKLFSIVNNTLLNQYNDQEKTIYNIPYNMQGTLPSGIYFLILQTNQKSYVRKIVVE